MARQLRLGWGMAWWWLIVGSVAWVAAAGPTTSTASGTTPPVYLPILADGQLGLNFYPIATGLNDPTDIAHAGDNRLFVALRNGYIHIIDAGAVLPTPFLDIHERVLSGVGEQGFLSLVFAPDYATSGVFYVTYTALTGSTHISRFHVSPTDPNQADPTSEQIVLTVPQADNIHKGGDLSFGPLDGYLYVPLGESGEPAHAQNGQLLTGKLLRLDVTGVPTYTIPADNPFVNDPAVRDEIWAMGLRNPWRISFDSLTGDLWIGDVGQSDWEEVNLALAGSGGGQNYGWPCYEAHHPILPQLCAQAGPLTPPLFAYPHGSECAITGGYRYRGSEFPRLVGHYLFADFCSGRFWSLAELNGSWNQQLLATNVMLPTTFGEDADGRLYVASWLTDTVFMVTAR